MKKFIYFLIAVVVIVGIAFFYITRPVTAPSVEAPTDTTLTDTPSGTASSSAMIFTLDKSTSSAKFELDETLRGSPFHVVGSTSEVSGDVTFDLATNKVGGLISVDGAAIKTDSTQRDGAIARLILHTTDSEKRFITFAPKTITGLPKDAKPDASYNFTVAGTLKANGVSKEVSWTVTAKGTAEGVITGTAKTTVKRSDFNLTIPNIPFVAGVSENVDLSIGFTLKKK